VTGSGQTAAAAAAAALELVGASPARAVLAATEAAEAARQEGDPAARSTALRALGLARRELGDLPAALTAVRAAVRGAERSGLAAPAAEARMSLAWVLLDHGRPAAALREADRAATALTGVPAARLRAQRALVLQRTGRLEEALQEFRTALPVLQRAGDEDWEARLRNNRGLLLAYRGDLDEAERDLERAAELFARLGQDLLCAFATWNLGFVSARRGDVRTALARFDATQASFAADVPVPDLLLDRAAVLLSAGLAVEAREAADTAADGLRALGRDADLAEAQLLQAQCALAAGDPHDGHRRAREAAGRFARQSRPGWALVARYVERRALAETGASVGTAATVRAADALERAGWRVLALDLRLLAVTSALAGSRLDVAEQQLTRAAGARGGAVDLRVRVWYAEALLRQRRGDRRGLDSALRAGLRAVDEHRATLGATELRVQASSFAGGLAGLGIREALRDRDPARVLLWSERWRAGTLRLRPVTPPVDGELAGLLADLRHATAELEGALLEGAPTGALRRRRLEAERAVLAASRHLAPDPGAALRTVAVPALRARTGDRALLVLATIDERVHAVVLAGGRLGLHDLGPAAAPARALEALHFALRRLALGQGSAAALAAARTAALAQAAALDDLLLGPVRGALGDRSLVVVPTAALHLVPWALLPSARGRAVVVAPSATLWHRADGQAATGTTGPGLLVAGPRLPGAQAEVLALAEVHPLARCLTGADAGAAPVLAALGQADWAHLAAHGHLRTDNPLFSALELADGPLTVYDLEHVPRMPGFVALPACQSGVGSVRAGEEVLGLAGALLARGARTLVASVLPIPDQASRQLMLDLHARLGTGQDVAAALAAAQAGTSLEDPAGLAAVAGFVSLGA